MQKHRISGVEPDSIAQELGIEAGDYLVALDDQPVLDVLDYRFRLATQRVNACFSSEEGQKLTAAIEKDTDEDLGLIFERPLMASKRHCTNHCLFCFVDQLPQKVRLTLRFKDDDWRLSFLQGNFVTLTNISDKELGRIIAQKISPINISVHTTDEDLRVFMLQNKRGSLIKRQLEKLASGGIAFYTQIVLCPGVNDREALTKTLTDLAKFRPYAKGVAIVPVGLTKYRQGLPLIKPVSRADALETIAIAEKFMRFELGDFVHLADEFFLLAEKPLPDAVVYGDFAQMEDGVGLLRHLIDGFEKALQNARPTVPHVLSVATGEAAYPTIQTLCKRAEQALGITAHVYPIKNIFFGGGVNVTGLLTGQCLLQGLAGKPLGQRLLLSDSMTRNGEEVFLDDMSATALSRSLNTRVEFVKNDGASLLCAMRMERE